MLGKSGRGCALWPLHKLIAGRQTPREACGRGLPGVDISTLVSALEMCKFLTWSLSFSLLVVMTGDNPAVPGRSDDSADVAPGPGS